MLCGNGGRRGEQSAFRGLPFGQEGVGAPLLPRGGRGVTPRLPHLLSPRPLLPSAGGSPATVHVLLTGGGSGCDRAVDRDTTHNTPTNGATTAAAGTSSPTPLAPSSTGQARRRPSTPRGVVLSCCMHPRPAGGAATAPRRRAWADTGPQRTPAPCPRTFGQWRAHRPHYSHPSVPLLPATHPPTPPPSSHFDGVVPAGGGVKPHALAGATRRRDARGGVHSACSRARR